MAAPGTAIEIGKPLRLGEVMAASIQFLGKRPLEYMGIGLVLTVAYLLTRLVPFAAGLAILALAFTVVFAVCARLVEGDRFGDALRRVGRAGPELFVLAFVVAVPFYLGSAWLILLLFSVGWLGLTGFAIPAAVLESSRDRSVAGRVAYALRRTATLARTEYIHAVGVCAALVIVYVLVGVLLAVALSSFADNGQYAAVAISQVVLAPFFFVGLTVLYFDQQARAREKED